LLLETDGAWADAVARQLRGDGSEVVCVSRGADVLLKLQRGLPSVLITELNPPDLSAKELLRRIRGRRVTEQLPVVVLGPGGDEIDRVVAFELGADDFLSKPFSVRELSLRVRAIVARTEGQAVSVPETLEFGPIRIHRTEHTVHVEGEPVSLSPLEFRLLSCLAEEPGRVRSRQELLSEVWGNQSRADGRAVDSSIKRLRHKLGNGGRWIETLRGVGYRLRKPPARSNPPATDGECQECEL
jgi:two-component system phosphate regulon response regulator PhoB